MKVLLTAAMLAALAACTTENIELRTGQPDAAPDATVQYDAAPARCVCLHACADSRDCLGLGDEICDTGQSTCEETEPLLDCTTSASCTGGRACVHEDDPASSCD